MTWAKVQNSGCYMIYVSRSSSFFSVAKTQEWRTKSTFLGFMVRVSSFILLTQRKYIYLIITVMRKTSAAQENNYIVGGSNPAGDDPRFLKTLQIDGRQERQQVCDTGSSIAISGSVWLSLCVLCYILLCLSFYVVFGMKLLTMN